MNTLKSLLLVTLMTASVAAMAEGGADRVMALMDAATASAQASAQPSATKTATASTQAASSSETARSN